MRQCGEASVTVIETADDDDEDDEFICTYNATRETRKWHGKCIVTRGVIIVVDRMARHRRREYLPLWYPFLSRLKSRTRRLGPRTHASPHTGQQKSVSESQAPAIGRSFVRKTIHRFGEMKLCACTSANETRSNGIHLVRRETRDSNGVHRVFLGLCEALSVDRRWSRSPDITTPSPYGLCDGQSTRAAVRAGRWRGVGGGSAAAATRRPPTRQRARPRAARFSPLPKRCGKKGPRWFLIAENGASERDATRRDETTRGRRATR